HHRPAARGGTVRRRGQRLPGRPRQGRDAGAIPLPAAVPRLLGRRRGEARRRGEEDRQGRMKARHAVAAAFIALAAGDSAAAEPAPNKALHELFDREFKRGLDEHPEQATFLGMPGYDDRLTDLSAAAVARRRAHVKEVGDELRRFDPQALNTQDRISRAILLDSVDLTLQQNELYGSLPFTEEDGWLPVSSMFGP